MWIHFLWIQDLWIQNHVDSSSVDSPSCGFIFCGFIFCGFKIMWIHFLWIQRRCTIYSFIQKPSTEASNCIDFLKNLFKIYFKIQSIAREPLTSLERSFQISSKLIPLNPFLLATSSISMAMFSWLVPATSMK